MNVAINGFGRIGRIFFRQSFEKENFDIVAINDLASLENLAYLLKYDSVYGRWDKKIETKEKNGRKYIVLVSPPSPKASEGLQKEILFLQEKDPAKLPWKELDIDVVVESTGVFASYEKAKSHLEAGAKRVVITAPADDEGETKTSTPNVGIEFIEEGKITSNASCTTNAITPVASVLIKEPGIQKAVLNTVHGYTSTQGLVDEPSPKDFRRGRGAGVNIVPSTTGAAKATGRAIPQLAKIFDGIAMRVPIIAGSLIDFTFLAKRQTSAEEINNILKKAAEAPEWQGILKVSEEPLVSTDILKEPYGSIVDLAFTKVVGGDLVKVLSWYDNEWGYCAMLIKHIGQLKIK